MKPITTAGTTLLTLMLTFGSAADAAAEGTGPQPPATPAAAAVAWPDLQPGQRFRDCPACPEMIVVPAGTFTMGSPADEPGRDGSEGPERPVTIARPFAIGVTEVTFDAWEACAQAGGCKGYLPPDKGFGRGQRPVVFVSWRDALGYCQWLAEQTGQAYRLPSEAEWEYAARAGTTTAIYTGALTLAGERNAPELDPIAWYSGNSGVDFDGLAGWDSADWTEKQYPHSRAGTRSVGGKQANAWGLHDMLGNVWEWVDDHWHDSYAGAPGDGTAWTDPVDTGYRVQRGGAWRGLAADARSARRLRYAGNERRSMIGFRCARGPEGEAVR